MLKDKPLLFADQMVASLTTFILTLLLARTLPVNDFGIFSIVFILVLLMLDVFRSLVTAPMMNKPMSLNKEQLYSGNLYLALLLILGLAVIILITNNIFCSVKDCFKSGVVSVPIILFTIGRLMHEFARAYSFIYYKYTNAFILDFAVLCLVLISTLIIKISNVAEALIYTGTAYLIPATIFIFVQAIMPSFDSLKKITSYNFGFGKWLALSSFLKWLNGNFIILVAVTLLGSLAAGTIRILNTLLAPIGICLQALENLVPIKAAELAKNDKALAYSYSVKIGLLSSGLAFLAVGFISIFAKTILGLFGLDYIQYYYLVPILGIAYVISAFSSQLLSCLRAFDNTRVIFKIYLINAIICLVFAYPIIKIFGIDGYAFGVITFQLLVVLHSYLNLKRGVKNA